MQYIDMHCDALMMQYVYDKKNNTLSDLNDLDYISVDFRRMKQGGQLAQFFAIFIPPTGILESYYKLDFQVDPEEYIRHCASQLKAGVAAHQDIIDMAYNASDIERNLAAGKMSAVMTMEDGVCVQGRMERIREFYDLGVRALSLTWNAENCFGAPNSKDPAIMEKGLTAFGREAVVYMQELGMLVDVSHLSDGGFYEVAKLCNKPFAATHSNSRVLSPHQRNLTDDMIRVLAEAGGVAGLNYGPEFTNSDITNPNQTAAQIARHARHMADVGGVDVVGLGGDLDGIEGNLEISDCSKVYLLEDALQKEGFSGAEIEKIFWKNTLRVMKDTM